MGEADAQLEDWITVLSPLPLTSESWLQPCLLFYLEPPSEAILLFSLQQGVIMSWGHCYWGTRGWVCGWRLFFGGFYFIISKISFDFYLNNVNVNEVTGSAVAEERWADSAARRGPREESCPVRSCFSCLHAWPDPLKVVVFRLL